jgi:hypothetical protein
MAEALSREDWERILHALRQFGHNLEFRATLEKVQRILEEPDRP